MKGTTQLEIDTLIDQQALKDVLEALQPAIDRINAATAALKAKKTAFQWLPLPGEPRAFVNGKAVWPPEYVIEQASFEDVFDYVWERVIGQLVAERTKLLEQRHAASVEARILNIIGDDDDEL